MATSAGQRCYIGPYGKNTLKLFFSEAH